VTVYLEPKQIPYHRFLSIIWEAGHCHHTHQLGVIPINIFFDYQFVMNIGGLIIKEKTGLVSLCFAGGCIDEENEARGGITIFTKRDYKICHQERDIR
jgi:hypothetical protein